MLQCFAYLCPDNIPFCLAERLLEQEGINKPANIQDIFNLISRYFLVQCNSEEKNFTISSLTQIIIRNQQSPQREVEVLKKIIDALNIEFYFIKNTQLNGPKFAVDALEIEYSHTENFSSSELANRKKLVSHLNALYLFLEKMLNTNVVMAELRYTLEQDILFNILSILKDYHSNEDNPRASQPFLERMLAIQESCSNKNHLTRAAILEDIGNMYDTLGNYQQAAEYLEKALKLREESLNKKDLLLERTLINLGICYKNLGDFAKSEEYLERALAIDNCYEKNVERIKLLESFGNLYDASGQYEKSKNYHEQALAIAKLFYEENNLILAEIWGNLGIACIHSGDGQKSKECFEISLKIQESSREPNHYKIARALENLARVSLPLQARQLLERALQIKEQYYGPTHNETERTRNLLNLNASLIKQFDMLTAVYRNYNNYLTQRLTDKSRVESKTESLISNNPYNLKNKIRIQDTSLVYSLNNKSKLTFFGVRDMYYKVDAVAKLNTKEDRKIAANLQHSLNYRGRFFAIENNEDAFVLEGINLSNENPMLIQLIRTYLAKK